MTTQVAYAQAAGKPNWSRYLGWGVLLAALAWAWQGAEMNPMTLVRDSSDRKSVV